MKRVVITLLMLVFFCSVASASLGFTPAYRELNYEPGKEIVVSFTVLTDNPENNISLSYGADKEFNNSVTLSQTEVRGENSFLVTLRMPDSVATPGVHGISITAKEMASSGGVIGTRIQASATIRIRVPYPGKYIEASLSMPDGNVGEEIPVQLNLVNRGTEELIARSTVNFYTLDRLAFTKTFAEEVIEPTEEKDIEYSLNTADLNAGDYYAKAMIDYGGKDSATADAKFRIGSLFVNVTNFTKVLPKGGVQKFFIEVESRWNSNLDNVFADVNLSNASMEKPIYFRTPSIELKAWEKKKLEGFLDTAGLEGKYNTIILLNYGEGQTLVNGDIFIGKKPAEINFVLIGGIVLLVLIVIALVIFFLRKKSKNAKRK